MTILIDMDDVLEQLLVGWTAYLNERYGTSVSAEDVKNWNVSLAYPMLTYEQVYPATHDDALWDYVPPMPGAVEAVKQLIDEGHDVYVVTATEYQSLKAKMDKVLFKYFPYLSFDKVIITKNKHLIKGDVLIDDGPHNLAGGDYKKLLYDASHNRTFDETAIGAVRVHNWAEVLEQIHRII